jgi:phosphohistidine swiveling domain-containing protein
LVQALAQDFPIQWHRPEDAERRWVWDAMHCPRPLTPLSIDFVSALLKAGFDASGALEEKWRPPLFMNGFLYSVFDPPSNQDQGPRQQEREARVAAEAPHLGRLWGRRWLPQIRRRVSFITGTGTAAMSTAELTAHVEKCIGKAASAFGITLYAAEAMFHGVEQLYQFCEAELGADGVALAGASIQGYANASPGADQALSELAALARRLNLSRIPSDAAELAGAEVGADREFATAFEKVMDRYGWRAPGWFELSEPAWREEPSVPLRLVREYFEGAAPNPREAQSRAAKARRAAIDKLRHLISDPERRSRFEELWRTARQFVPVSEGRALWQLSLGGFLRIPVLDLGQRLAETGDLPAPEDIFYLRLDELRAGPETAWRSTIQRRREERERWLPVVPPMTIGNAAALAPPAGAGAQPPVLPFGARMIGGYSLERGSESNLLKGNAASPGLVTGTARVLETVDDAWKLQAGDILVCRFTTPSWSHLFSRVSAIVADAGGVLSHCAILAREYAIPCVAGVRVGTRRIRDGMTVTVDGSQGIVRLDG